jgi:hypothetical protein
MKNRVVLLVFIPAMIIGLGLSVQVINWQQRKALDNAGDLGSAAWCIRKARLEGDKQVILPGLFCCPPAVSGLQEALSQFRVVLAKPIARDTKTDFIGLVTWYKFKVMDDLSSVRWHENSWQNCVDCGNVSNDTSWFPAALLPLEEDEILVPHRGGEVIIDGLRVVQPFGIPVDFSTGTKMDYARIQSGNAGEDLPIYKAVVYPKPYLLFLSMPEFSKVGRLSLCERGIYICSPEGEFQSIGDFPDIFKLEMDNLRVNSLEKLKAYAQQVR